MPAARVTMQSYTWPAAHHTVAGCTQRARRASCRYMPIIALYQPDIAANVGAIIRLCACLGVPLHIIEPCGFPWDERRVKQVAMDYLQQCALTRHVSWRAFQQDVPGRRVLLTTKAAVDYRRVEYTADDVLLLGRESAGVPDDVHEAADIRVAVTMASKARSLNVGMAAAMVLGEAMRQHPVGAS